MLLSRNTTYHSRCQSALLQLWEQRFAQGHFARNIGEIKRQVAHFSQFSDMDMVKLSEYYWLPRVRVQTTAELAYSRRETHLFALLQHVCQRKILSGRGRDSGRHVYWQHRKRENVLLHQRLWQVSLWAATSSIPDILLLHLVAKTYMDYT